MQASVSSPKHNWFAEEINHESIGLVTKIGLDSSPGVRVAEIDFDEKTGWWVDCDELEVV